MENQKTESTTTFFEELGFADEKEFNKFNSKARALWKGSHKQVTYNIDLPNPAETNLLKADTEIAIAYKQYEEKKEELIQLVEHKLLRMRGLIEQEIEKPMEDEADDDTPIQANNQNPENPT